MRKCTAQKIEALAIELGMHEREAGNITARMREALGEASLYRAHYHRSHDRNAAARVQCVGAGALWHYDIDR